MRILMVENHATFASTVASQFLAAHEVTIVPSLATARAALAKGFDAVLVDYDLDDGKGEVLVRELVAASFSGRIVAISSHDEGNAALKVAGAHACCPKLRFADIERALGV